MAIFRHVYTKFWEDSLVIEKMNESDKLFFLYLLTNRNTTQIGIYAITVRQISFELGYSSEMVKELIAKFENELELIIYDEKTSEVAIKNWGKYNLNKGGKPIVDCITKELKDVKNKELIKIVSEKIEKDGIGEVKVLGKRWSAYSNKEIEVNRKIKVLSINGVKLKVEEIKESD